MRVLTVVALLLLSVSIHAADPIDPDVLEVREAAWRAWFAGDDAALRAMLPDNFLAIGANATGEISDRDKTLAQSRAFKESGGRLLSLSFPETRAQRFGDTVVLYGSYEATFTIEGKETTMRGRLTEVFVKRDGRWVHPGWHLDARALDGGAAKGNEAGRRPAAASDDDLLARLRSIDELRESRLGVVDVHLLAQDQTKLSSTNRSSRLAAAR